MEPAQTRSGTPMAIQSAARDARRGAVAKYQDLVVGSRAEGVDRDQRAAAHGRIFERWLEEERSRIGVRLTYEELL